MRRFGYLYEQICSYDNLEEAFRCAAKKKRKRNYVKRFASNLEANLLHIQNELQTHTFQTSSYSTFVVHEPKERLIFRLPFRDRIVHWAVMLITESIWTKNLTRDTYACVKKRGIHPLLKKLKEKLHTFPAGTEFCLKIDVTKFYPSIKHDLLKDVIRSKIKDPHLLILLDGIIDSADGVPIGNYLSQYFANIYLSELDHLLKEYYDVNHYFRYADDMVVLAGSKEELHGLLVAINDYLIEYRHLFLKNNYQIFSVEDRGIDFIGYVTRHKYVLARKENKKRLCRKLAKLRKKGLSDEEIRQELSSFVGFMKHCNSRHLLNILGLEMKKFSDFKKEGGNLTGSKYHIDAILGKEIHLKGFDVTDSKYEKDKKCLTIQYDIEEQLRGPNGELLTNEDGTPKMGWVEHITFTGSEALIRQLDGVEFDEPCAARIIKQTIGDKGKCFYNIVDP